MAFLVDFQERAESRIRKLAAKFPGSPRLQALKLGLWSLGKAAGGRGMVSGARKYRSRQAGPLKIAFMNMGGFGDAAISLNWIYQFITRLGCPFLFDMYSNLPEAFLRMLTDGWPGRNAVSCRGQAFRFEDYDLVLHIFSMPVLLGMDESRVRASSFAFDYCQRLQRFASANPELFRSDNFLHIFQYAKLCGRHRWAESDFDGSLGLEQSGYPVGAGVSKQEIMQKFGLRGTFITVQREAGFKRDGKRVGESTKLWPKENYAALVDRMAEKCGRDHSIVLIGVEKNFEAGDAAGIVDLRGKTSFEDLLSLAKHAGLHVGCEGMLPHFRHAVGGGASIVVFGPSDSDYFNYPENIALHGQECPHGCESVTRAWSSACVKGYPCCKSIGQVSVEDVFREVEKKLGFRNAV